MFSTSLLWFFSSRIDQIVVGRFAGVPALGVYVIAGKVPDMAKVVTHEPMAHVSLPPCRDFRTTTSECRQRFTAVWS